MKRLDGVVPLYVVVPVGNGVQSFENFHENVRSEVRKLKAVVGCGNSPDGKVYVRFVRLKNAENKLAFFFKLG